MKTEGKICLSVSIADTTYIVEFLIIYAPSPYNCIFGRPTLNICDLAIEILVREEEQTIYGDQKVAQECFFFFFSL